MSDSVVELDAANTTLAVSGLFQACGAPADVAADVAQSLVDAELSGHPSHGVIRVSDYVRFKREGRLVPDARPSVSRVGPSVLVVDGRHGFGHLGARTLTEESAAIAKEGGVAVGSLFNVAHIGRLGEWAEIANRLGVYFFMCAGWLQGKNAAPFGGSAARLSTNPLTFGAGGLDGLVVDIATTTVAEGKVRVHLDQGKRLPTGWVLDAAGKPSTDPNDLYAGGTLELVGGHKGYGLSLMVAVLGAAVAGAGGGGAQSGVFALALDPGVFGSGRDADQATAELLRLMRETPSAEGVDEVIVPGDVERRNRERAAGRIALPHSTLERLFTTAESLGIARAAFSNSLRLST